MHAIVPPTWDWIYVWTSPSPPTTQFLIVNIPMTDFSLISHGAWTEFAWIWFTYIPLSIDVFSSVSTLVGGIVVQYLLLLIRLHDQTHNASRTQYTTIEKKQYAQESHPIAIDYNILDKLRTELVAWWRVILSIAQQIPHGGEVRTHTEYWLALNRKYVDRYMIMRLRDKIRWR